MPGISGHLVVTLKTNEAQTSSAYIYPLSGQVVGDRINATIRSDGVVSFFVTYS